jgi:predicted lipoprotein with Yx(FWY)xxD motif
MEDIVIRRTRMAMGAISGMALALALAGCGAQAQDNAGANPRLAAGDQNPAVDVPLPGTGVDAPADGENAEDGENAQPDGGGANAAPTDSSVTLIAKDVPKMGQVVTDAKGFTLYRFDKDGNKPAKSNCNGACAELWPPVLSEGVPVLQGINPSKVGTVIRQNGTQQVTLDGWPLYTYKKDLAPAKWKGQAVGGTWWVVAPDGKRNISCLPPGAKPPGEAGAAEGAESGKGDEDAAAPGGETGGDTGGGYDY